MVPGRTFGQTRARAFPDLLNWSSPVRQKKEDGWYSRKSFPHLDLPMNFDPAKKLVTEPKSVTSHAFKPFIGYTDRKRRFTPNQSPNHKYKERDIKYCSHVDGYIHSYYARLLTLEYEKFLNSVPWEKSVTGYRAGLGTNIHLAKNAFNEVKKRDRCVAVAIDVSDFFGSIDHAILLENLKTVLGKSHLPEDWFKVYRSMTRFSWVEGEELIEKLKLDPKDLPRPYCDMKTFRALRDADPGFIRTNLEDHGIPQGSPISAVMSNVFMIGFDQAIYRYIKSIRGYYRRYSDDIFIVCDPERLDEVISTVQTEISNLGSSMTVSPEKTEISQFTRVSPTEIACDEPISYLGFTYDGVRTSLRSRTLSRYYRRMTYATRGAIRAAEETNSATIFKRKLYRDFTHLGGNNFYSYAKRASKILGDEMPRRQLRRHVPILKRKIRNRGR